MAQRDRTEGAWKNFLNSASQCIFQKDDQDYLVLIGGVKEIVAALIKHGFLERMGNLNQGTLQIGITKEERLRHPIIGSLAGGATLYKVCKPLAQFSYLLIEKLPVAKVVLVTEKTYKVLGLLSKKKAEKYLKDNGYQKVHDGYWASGDSYIYIKNIENLP